MDGTSARVTKESYTRVVHGGEGVVVVKVTLADVEKVDLGGHDIGALVAARESKTCEYQNSVLLLDATTTKGGTYLKMLSMLSAAAVAWTSVLG